MWGRECRVTHRQHFCWLGWRLNRLEIFETVAAVVHFENKNNTEWGRRALLKRVIFLQAISKPRVDSQPPSPSFSWTISDLLYNNIWLCFGPTQSLAFVFVVWRGFLLSYGGRSKWGWSAIRREGTLNTWPTKRQTQFAWCWKEKLWGIKSFLPQNCWYACEADP